MQLQVLRFASIALLSSSLLVAQTSTPATSPKPQKSQQAAKPSKSASVPKRSATKAPKLDARKQFALDVVQSAVAIPQSDPQDRLRVLSAAATIILPLRPALAKQLSKEGLRIEQELIQSGQAPAASMLDTGKVDCPSVQALVENVPVERMAAAEQTLISAVSNCPNTVPTAQRLVEHGLDNRAPAPRLTLALAEKLGPKTPWSQQQFEKLFGTLPDPAQAGSEVANFASMYARMASEVDRDVAQKVGIRLLTWIGKVPESSERNLAVNITTGSMKEALGAEAYDRALESDVIARQVAQTAGQAGEIEHAPEESTSVLQAMNNTGNDTTNNMNQLPPSQRARDAAASGFANGTEGKRKLADRFFDVAFSALDQVWGDRESYGGDATAIVQEVSEAAAHVDAVDALQRVQKLQDPAAQAIGMVAVARVVASQEPEQVSAAR